MSSFVCVWVSGDGGDWACGPSTHYRIPTPVFDREMTVGRLNTGQDLAECAQQAQLEMKQGLRKDTGEFTNVWVAHDGNWAGSPPLRFEIPSDVFAALTSDDQAAQRTIGALSSERDLLALVEQTRLALKDEMGAQTADDVNYGNCSLCGKRAKLASSGDRVCSHCLSIRTGAVAHARANSELKACGHRCTTSSCKEGCCKCLDVRPLRSSGYPMYRDGVGWVEDAAREEGYCPNCRLDAPPGSTKMIEDTVAVRAARAGLNAGSLQFAQLLDAEDPLALLRDEFLFPAAPPGCGRDRVVYLCGNSLGLQPKGCRMQVAQQLDKWAAEGVEGHFTEPTPWLTIDDTVRDSMANVVGARPSEVVLMNSLTSNLHFMMASFFCPRPGRDRVIIEKKAFPSDVHAVTSQLLHHGLDPTTTLLELSPRPGEVLLRQEDIEAAIEEHGDSVALLLLSGVQYYTGQLFNLQAITRLARAKGCFVGWDLAHAVGNVELKLHDWGCDFACWCTYKYLNCGPGSIGGAFVHERHGGGGEADACRRRLAGWWGHRLDDRFVMDPRFVACEGANGFRVSNPPVLLVACVRASLDVFEKVGTTNPFYISLLSWLTFYTPPPPPSLQAGGMSALRAKSLLLTGLLEHLLLTEVPEGEVTIFTPSDPAQRGCQLSLSFRQDLDAVFSKLQAAGVVCDVRKPNVMRVAPAPLYNSAQDVFDFVQLLKGALKEC